MTHDNLIKVQLKTGVSFAYLDRKLNDILVSYLETPRNQYIINEAKSQFDFSLLEEKESVKVFSKLLKSKGYKNKAEWLSETVRKTIQSFILQKTFQERQSKIKTDYESLSSHKLELSLTDKELEILTKYAYEAGFKNAGGLLSSFVIDLVDFGRTNGSDERECADAWYDRAFGTRYHKETYYFTEYCLEKGFDDPYVAIDMLEDDELFENEYNNYLSDLPYNDGENCQPKDECKEILRMYATELKASINVLFDQEVLKWLNEHHGCHDVYIIESVKFYETGEVIIDDSGFFPPYKLIGQDYVISCSDCKTYFNVKCEQYLDDERKFPKLSITLNKEYKNQI